MLGPGRTNAMSLPDHWDMLDAFEGPEYGRALGDAVLPEGAAEAVWVHTLRG